MELVDFTSIILPQIMLNLGVVVMLKLIVMIVIPVEIVAHCVGKIDWYNFSDSLSMIMNSLLWFSLVCHLFNTSSSWHEPVLTLGHWEPNILIFLSHFLHEIDWLWEVW